MKKKKKKKVEKIQQKWNNDFKFGDPRDYLPDVAVALISKKCNLAGLPSINFGSSHLNEENGKIIQEVYDEFKQYIDHGKKKQKLCEKKILEEYFSLPKVSLEFKKLEEYKNYQDYFEIFGGYVEKNDKEIIYTTKSEIKLKDDDLKLEIVEKNGTVEERAKVLLETAQAKGWNINNLNITGGKKFLAEIDKQIKKMNIANEKQKEEEKISNPNQRNAVGDMTDKELKERWDKLQKKNNLKSKQTNKLKI